MRGLALVFVAAAFCGLGQPGADDPYSTALARYQAGDRAGAMELLGTLQPDEIQKQVEALSAVTIDSSGPAATRRRRAAAMLHTEFALFADADDRRVRSHIESAHVLLSADRQQLLPHRRPAPTGAGPSDAQETGELLSRWTGVAAGGFLVRGMDWDARHYVDEMLRLIPEEPRMLFWRARISEFSAVWSPSRPLPGNRAPAFAARDPEALMLDAGFMRSLWGPVETDYRRAVAAAPGDAEARLHLGYVLLLLRRYPEARAELETASKAPNDRDVSYLGHLFLGRLCEAQRDLDAAASAYERALDVEPRAQSGLVALSLLEDMRGNRGRARSLIAAFATQPARQANDPWWSYHGSRVSSADLEWLRGRVRP